MKRHNRDDYYVIGEGILTLDSNDEPITVRPSAIAEVRKFRFSRLGPVGAPIDDTQRLIAETVATAMTTDPAGGDPESSTKDHGSPGSGIPSGFTYLGQFVDHDLTRDNNSDRLGQDVTVDELVQGRSPSLDLDSLYGRGPQKDPRFYADDGVSLKSGSTTGVGQGAPGADNPFARAPHDGFDLPRVGTGPTLADQRLANIPDQRNDENLAVAQTHLAFIRFHNRVVRTLAGSTPSVQLFSAARNTVVRHYQWMLRTDFLPRVVDPAIVTDVFTNGRRFFEVPAAYGDLGWYPQHGGRNIQPGDLPTMPIEFSVAAYRLGHSMVRDAYEWNAIFNKKQGIPATLLLLFAFSGTSGILAPTGSVNNLNDPNIGGLKLPSNWVADFRRLYDFSEAKRDDLTVDSDDFNITKRIDTLLVNPLQQLPLGTFGGRDATVHAAGRQLNLAFRNLTRAGMVRLGSGQQLAEYLEVPPLTTAQIIAGNQGASLDQLTADQKDSFAKNTPLWFYILREAELNGGRLTGVGGRIVAEVFHRAMEGSNASIVRDPSWRPSLGPDNHTFRMVDLLLFAFEGKKELLAPLG
ncbi:heme peroxidase family protein [Frankia sp. Cj3]|uniref:peroxidase family protein n=1 Tax=Frankia sp. Cj3 TaxID=2880976 RepID=UPI001EF4EA20|nr:heme peroxidase family protein [Frankia sp. Cj3]